MNKMLLMSALGIFLMAGCTEHMTVQGNDQKPFAFKSTDEPVLPSPPPTVNSRHVTLSNLNLNNMGSEIMIKPGKFIQASLNYDYHCTNCNPDLNNQIIIGLAHRSAQACIYDGGAQGQGSASFELKVPAKPGKYDVQFRAVQTDDCAAALKAGWDSDDSPAKDITIGRIVASKKAETTP